MPTVRRLSERDAEAPPTATELLNLHANNVTSTASSSGLRHDINFSPLFSRSAENFSRAHGIEPKQFSLLGHKLPNDAAEAQRSEVDAVYLNTNVPLSTFICGSQGAGKSHTLSCMLENCLFPSLQLGVLRSPSAGILFHYDEHTSETPCEAAHLANILPVTVLVSPSNFWQRERIYKKLQPQIKVRPLLFQEQHLSIRRMQRLMAFKESDGSIPLYMELVTSILRKMAIEQKDRRGLDYTGFLRQLEDEVGLSSMQKGPLKMRMGLLESFMALTYPFQQTFGIAKHAALQDPFDLIAGSLTIVDLSDALIDPPSACNLFDMCLSLFFESRRNNAKIVALDEAHKFLTATDAGDAFTESILQVVREQRHKGARIIISTQEPTISPKLLDLCSMTFVHRFSSPAWLEVLSKHMLAAGKAGLMERILQLVVGEAIVFAPQAALSVEDGQVILQGSKPEHIMMRKRVSSDGGKSVMAMDN